MSNKWSSITFFSVQNLWHLLWTVNKVQAPLLLIINGTSWKKIFLWTIFYAYYIGRQKGKIYDCGILFHIPITQWEATQPTPTTHPTSTNNFNIWYCYTFLSIELSIFEPKHRGDRTILVYWYIGIYQYTNIPIYQYTNMFRSPLCLGSNILSSMDKKV